MEESNRTMRQAGEELDPALEGGFCPLFDKQMPVQLRTQSEEVSSLDAIRIRIFGIPDAEEPFKIQLLSERDLFFQYQLLLTKYAFQILKKQQRLHLQYARFLQMLTKITGHCLKQPNLFFAVLHIKKKHPSQAILSFIENVDHKFVQLLALQFNEVSPQKSAASVTYRFNLMKARMLETAQKVKKISQLIKVKNPSLLSLLHKNYQGPGDIKSELGQSRHSKKK